MEVVVEGYVTLLGRGLMEVLREGEGEGERYHGDGHDSWVGDVDGADHVRAIGFWCEFDGEIRDCEAVELVQA